ncbi:MAG: hypothetical protein AB7E48_09715 [Deferribacterales bacterium]
MNKPLLIIIFSSFFISACAGSQNPTLDALKGIETEMRKMREETTALKNRIQELETKLDGLSDDIEGQTAEIQETKKSLRHTEEEIEALR